MVFVEQLIITHLIIDFLLWNLTVHHCHHKSL
jgi:hypothetical protein